MRSALSLHRIILVPVILSTIKFRWSHAVGPVCTGVGNFSPVEVINYQWVSGYDSNLDEGENVEANELDPKVCQRAATAAVDDWRDWKHPTQAWRFTIKKTGTKKTVNANFLVTHKGAVHLSVIERNKQYTVYYGGVRLEPEDSKSKNDASSSTST